MDTELFNDQNNSEVSSEPTFVTLPSQEPGKDEVEETGAESIVEEETAIEISDDPSPSIPTEIYNLLPEILQIGSGAFKTPREKDVFLISAVTLLSGCFPTVYGVYDGKKVNANLFSFIIAPAASGKSALIAGRELVLPIHHFLLNQSSMESLTIGPETQPSRRLLFIPGNISSTAIIAMLKENDGVGVICESEADTLSNAIKQEWGGFSDSLRKAFHHEHISYARMKDNVFIEVPKPRLSVLLSGTPNQLNGIIRGIEDGLFSRFIFYKYNSKPKWRDPSPNGSGVILETYMEGIQNDIKHMYDLGQTAAYRFDLTTIQWLKLNNQYTKALNKAVTFVGDETASNVYRLGLIHYRVAMVLSILRHFKQDNPGNDIVCNDVDYGIAEILSEVFLHHEIVVYKALAKKAIDAESGAIAGFYRSLPIIPFQRKDAVQIGAKLGISERTINTYLAKLTERGFLKHIRGGPYEIIPD